MSKAEVVVEDYVLVKRTKIYEYEDKETAINDIRSFQDNGCELQDYKTMYSEIDTKYHDFEDTEMTVKLNYEETRIVRFEETAVLDISKEGMIDYWNTKVLGERYDD